MYEPLIDDRSDPDSRAVLEDAELALGWRPTRLGLALGLVSDAADEAARDAADEAHAADAAPNGDADAAEDAEAAAPADAAEDAEAAVPAADAADASYYDAYASRQLTALLTKDPDMRNGLKIIQVPGRYGWSVTRVGWLRRVAGDEWELLGARSIVRSTPTSRTLDSLAEKGPADDHRLTDIAIGIEEIHRLVIRRSLPANPEAWIRYCPRPPDWRDEGNENEP